MHPQVAIGPSLNANNTLKLAAWYINLEYYYLFSANAILNGVYYVRPVDVDSLVIDILCHRIILRDSNLYNFNRKILHNIIFEHMALPK